MAKMSQEKDLVPSAIMEMFEADVEDEEPVESHIALPDIVVAKVLSYLPLRERFRLETVCRQWQRFMFLKVEHLNLHFYQGDQNYTLEIENVGKIVSSQIPELSAVLQKLRKIEVGHLKCKIDSECSDRVVVLVLLAKIASRANEVEFCYSITKNSANLVTFCDIIGPHVTTFQLYQNEWLGFPQDITAYVDAMAKMKRLKELSSNWLKLIFICLNCIPVHSLPHFQAIELWYGTDCDSQLWNHFKSVYGKKIKKIKFSQCDLLDDVGVMLSPLKELEPFTNLRYLKLECLEDYGTLTDFAEDLEAVTRSCPLLTSFHLGDFGAGEPPRMVLVAEVQKLFVAIGKMKMLEELNLELDFDYDDLGDVSWEENLDMFALLENGSSITRLEAYVVLCLISSHYVPIRRGIYGTLNKAMHNLKHLDVVCFASELDHFVGMQRLKSITLDFHLDTQAESESIQGGLISILTSNPALESIKCSHKFAEVSEALLATIINVAKLQMEKHIDFVANIGVVNKSQEVWDAMKHLAPRNLTLTFD